jgi:uncharacterized membrane protein YfcA
MNAMLLGLTPGSFAFALAVLLIGGFVRGYSGFGASMIWVSGLSLVVAPAVAVPTVLLLEVVASIHLLPKVWRDVHWRSLAWLLAGALVATPFGIMTLARVPADPMRMAIAIIVIIAAVLIWRGFRLETVPGRGAALATGAVSGALNGATTVGGPPVILFFFSSPAGVAMSRASVIAYFLGTDSLASAMAAGQGLVDGTLLLRAAVFLPVVLIGVALGHRRFVTTDAETFRRMVLLLLVTLSAAGLARAMWT